MQYTRTYTISSAPERADGCITITVKAVAGGRMSHHLVRRVARGDYLPLGLPQGEFYLPDAQPVRPLFVTAGSGITPAMSMLRSLVAQERVPDTVHLHYAPHAYDVIFGAELTQLASTQARYRLHLSYTREPGETESRRRHFTPRQLEEVWPRLARARDLRLRPAGPSRRTGVALATEGIERRLHIERSMPRCGASADVQGGRVRFSKSEIVVQADGRTTSCALPRTPD
jgi:ferredoxin-NADP reductase